MISYNIYHILFFSRQCLGKNIFVLPEFKVLVGWLAGDDHDQGTGSGWLVIGFVTSLYFDQKYLLLWRKYFSFGKARRSALLTSLQGLGNLFLPDGHQAFRLLVSLKMSMFVFCRVPGYNQTKILLALSEVTLATGVSNWCLRRCYRIVIWSWRFRILVAVCYLKFSIISVVSGRFSRKSWVFFFQYVTTGYLVADIYAPPTHPAPRYQSSADLNAKY